MRNDTCPVCGQPVNDSSPSMVHAGKTYFFRCQHCLQAFAQDPQRYLSGSKPSGCCGKHGHGGGSGGHQRQDGGQQVPGPHQAAVAADRPGVRLNLVWAALAALGGFLLWRVL